MQFHFNDKSKLGASGASGTSGGSSSGNKIKRKRKPGKTQNNRHTRFIILTILLLLPVFSLLFVIRGISSTGSAGNADNNNRPARENSSWFTSDASDEKSVTAEVPVITELTIKKNDTFYTILNQAGMEPAEIALFSQEAGKLYDLRKVREGQKVKLVKSGGEVVEVEYLYDRLEGLRIERQLGEGVAGSDGAAPSPKSASFKAETFEVPHRVVQEVVSATIENSLYGAGVSVGADPKILMELTDIFAWDVDFATDIRKGDSFSILYEAVYVDDEVVSIGRILGAEVINSGDTFTAFYYKDSKGKAEYFDSQGRSLRRVLLKSPLRYRRISSHFSRRRFHPIHKKYRAHHGIDYAAPRGTPVEVSGAGKVIYAGWKGGYGNFVLVRHNGVYTTAYGHLKKIRKGIRKGKRVGQGDVIGYVGSTGNSTGPHLHYEVRVRGKVVNPLGIKSKPGRTLGKTEMARFNGFKGQVTAKLAQKPTIVASLADNN